MKKLLIIIAAHFITNSLISQSLEYNYANGEKQIEVLFTNEITQKTNSIRSDEVYIDKVIDIFSLKNFCIGLSDLCDMTSKEINQMEVQTPDILGNLWKQKFLNKFSIYHNQINASQEIVFIDFSNTEDVNSNVIIDLLVNCSGVKKINDTTFESNKVEIKLMDEGGLLMLQFNYPKKE